MPDHDLYCTRRISRRAGANKEHENLREETPAELHISNEMAPATGRSTAAPTACLMGACILARLV